MKIKDFKLEQFFNKYEFSAPHLMCCSDCESITIEELLALEPGSKERFMDTWLGYSESPGDPELLLGISEMYQNVDEGGILEFVGAQEAILNFMNNALEKGDHMITMFPAYQSTYEICYAIGCEVSNWELVQTEDGWAVDLDALESLIRPNTKVIAVCSPNNPTGYTLSEEECRVIAGLAGRHGIKVFSDEVYRGLAVEEPPSFADMYENAWSLNVMSKAYGLPGLRLGWVASQSSELYEAMLNFKYYTSICGPAPSQKLSIIAVKHRDKIFARNRAIIEGNLSLSDTFFKKHENIFQYNRPMAGPIAFHRLKADVPIASFCDGLVSKKGLLLAYDALFDKGGNYFRMGYGRKSFKACLGLLDEYVSEL